MNNLLKNFDTNDQNLLLCLCNMNYYSLINSCKSMCDNKISKLPKIKKRINGLISPTKRNW